MVNTIILFVIINFLLIQCDVFAHTTNDRLIYLNSPLSLQHGVSSNPGGSFSAIDLNVNLILLNISANYQSDSGCNAYIGMGLISFLQAQYGYSFRDSRDLLRIRSDIPLVLFEENNPIIKSMSVGLFYEASTEKNDKLSKFGLSLSVNTMIIFQK